MKRTFNYNTTLTTNNNYHVKCVPPLSLWKLVANTPILNTYSRTVDKGWPNSQYYQRIYPQGPSKASKNLSQDRRSLGQDLNLGSPECMQKGYPLDNSIKRWERFSANWTTVAFSRNLIHGVRCSIVIENNTNSIPAWLQCSVTANKKDNKEYCLLGYGAV
jgi:hypothetical protein